jgi:spermidine synthase
MTVGNDFSMIMSRILLFFAGDNVEETAEEQLTRGPGKAVVSLVLACFFLSGLTGLIYEILWTRMIVKIIGAAPFAVSIVLTVFMGGLGLGAYLAGGIIDRHKTRPVKLVRLYGCLELVIGAYGLIIPALLAGARPLYSLLYNHLFSNFIIYNLLSFVGCAVILLVPVVCMGATLPVLCQFYVRRLSHLGSHTGRLYGLNTIGAALGALLCGFWLINFLGIWGTLIFAIVINTFIGLSCIVVSGTRRVKNMTDNQVAACPEPPSEDFCEKEPSVQYRRDANGALVVFMISGFCAMAYEVFWTKLLGLLVGPTTYSVTIVLVTFILGLALGSMLFGWLADKTGRAIWLLLFTQVGAALFVLSISQIMGNSQLFFAKLIFDLKDRFALLAFTKAAVLFALMILPTLCLGATFPLVGKIYTNSVSRVGKSIGFAYMANTIGALLGSFSAGFILIPLFGKQNSLQLVIGLQLLTALIIGFIIPARKKQNLAGTTALAVSTLTGLILCFYFPFWDPALLSVGRYHRFEEIKDAVKDTGFKEALLHGPEIMSPFQQGEMVYYKDGMSGFTTVLRYPNPLGGYDYALTISGKTDASSFRDMTTQTLSAHFPMLFHPNPRKVMVLGLASGVTAGEVLCYPVEQLDILEINRSVMEASDFFRPWNNEVLLNPKTNLIIQDGRAHLQLTNQKYDVIISEPSNPWMSGLSALFTIDYFTLAKNHLNEDGIYVQFMHSYQMDWRTFSLIGRTFAQVFPDSILVSTDPADTLLDFLFVGFKGAQKLNLEQAERNLSYAQQSENISLADPKLLYRLIVSEDLSQIFGQGPVNSDNHPLLEFAAPKLMYQDDIAILQNLDSGARLSEKTKDIIRQFTSDVNSQIDFAAYALSVKSPFSNMVDLSKASREQKERFFKLVGSYCIRNTIDSALLNSDELTERLRRIQIDHIEKNIELMPDKSVSYLLLGDLYSEQNRFEDAEVNYQNSLRLNPDNAYAHIHLGVIFGKQGKIGQALPHFERALKNRPYEPILHRNLGLVYTGQGKFELAAMHYSKALQIKPDFIEARRELGDVLIEQRRFEQAIVEYQKILEISALDAEGYNNLGVALANQGRIYEAVTDFSEALRIDPALSSALRNIRNALSLQNSPEQAVHLLEHACDVTEEQNPFLLADLSILYKISKRFSDADAAAEKAIGLADSSGDEQFKHEIQKYLQMDNIKSAP